MKTIRKNHPLVGTWITDEEDSDAALVIKVARGKFIVSGFSRSDGEPMKINNLQWDGEALSFDTLMLSTKYRSQHVLRLRCDSKVDHELTISEIWKKKDVRPRQRPEAWSIKPKKLPTTPRTLRLVPRRK